MTKNSKAVKGPLEVSPLFSNSVQANRNVDNSSNISVALFSSQANSLNNIHSIPQSNTTNITSNATTIPTIDEDTTLSTNDPNLITLKEINSTATTQLSNLNSNSYNHNNNITLLTTNKNENIVTSNLNLNNVETNILDTNNINPNIQNTLLSSVQAVSPSQTFDIDIMDLHQSSKWKDSEVRKILIYLSDTKNFQKYCKEKKTKTYNKLAEMLSTKTSAQIKNKLSSLESTYRRIKSKYQDFLQNFNPRDSKQVKLYKDNVLKEFPFFFEMDEIFHAKLQSDMENVQKILKKNYEDNKISEDLPSSSDNSNQIKKNSNIEDSITNILTNSEEETISSILNNETKSSKKRKLNENDILEISNNTKEIIKIFRESEEKRLKLQQDYDDRRLILKKLLAEKEWENKLALEEKKLEIQKQHNRDMKVLKERELDLEESKQKLEREKLELEKVQINLQIKLYEEKLINHYQNNDLSRGLSSINSTLATLNNFNNLNSVQVLQNNNNLKLDSQKK